MIVTVSSVQAAAVGVLVAVGGVVALGLDWSSKLTPLLVKAPFWLTAPVPVAVIVVESVAKSPTTSSSIELGVTLAVGLSGDEAPVVAPAVTPSSGVVESTPL